MYQSSIVSFGHISAPNIHSHMYGNFIILKSFTHKNHARTHDMSIQKGVFMPCKHSIREQKASSKRAFLLHMQKVVLRAWGCAEDKLNPPYVLTNVQHLFPHQVEFETLDAGME